MMAEIIPLKRKALCSRCRTALDNRAAGTHDPAYEPPIRDAVGRTLRRATRCAFWACALTKV
jgi:hypothetical protein